MLFCRLWIFFKILFQKHLSGIPSECQLVWSQIRPNVLSGLTWVQPVCKGYQQMTKKVVRERVKVLLTIAADDILIVFVIFQRKADNSHENVVIF